MILHVDPQAPLAVKAAASAILYAHIGGGALGLTSGALAMAARKGGSLHRAAGQAFLVGMAAMGGVGAAVAPFLPSGQGPNTFMGVFTVYLTATAWMTARRRPGEIGRFEVLAAVVAGLATLGVLAAGIAAVDASADPSAPPAAAPFVFAAMAALAASLDLSVLRRGGLGGADRITRHLWRMGLALLITSFSFAGQPRAIPGFLHGSPLVLAPLVLTAVATAYWLVRVRMPRRVAAAG